MVAFESTFFDLGYIETLANQETVIHRLDPRAKVATTLMFLVVVMSFPRYALSGLMPFLLFPAILMTAGNLPVGYLAKRIGVVLPFIGIIGIFNPLLDRTIVMRFGAVGISGGWVSLGSILLRGMLTISSALILIATTGLPGIGLALERLGVPKIFVVQLLFVYRYLFVLLDEAARLARARALRSFSGKGLELKVWGSLIGHLLLRTIDRARRIHLAMLSRGFTGDIRLTRRIHFRVHDALFLLGWGSLFLIMRRYNVALLIGNLLTRLLP